MEDDDEVIEPERCSVCGGPLTYLGHLGLVAHFRCRDCGTDCNRERTIECPRCKGAGLMTPRKQTCPYCGGSGRVKIGEGPLDLTGSSGHYVPEEDAFMERWRDWVYMVPAPARFPTKKSEKECPLCGGLLIPSCRRFSDLWRRIRRFKCQGCGQEQERKQR